MQERHSNKKKYFEEQNTTSGKHVIPFIEDVIEINKNISVLEIGCGEGGNLLPFLDRGCKKVVGIDLSESKIKNAQSFYEDHPQKENIQFILADIYDIKDLGTFDIILLRDVIEHIHDQNKFMGFVKKFLNPTGKIFFGFPPWYNPFGGHQQICESKILSKFPYFHLLTKFLYKGILKIFGESEAKIDALLEIRETGISIERFERILSNENYKIDKRTFYLINPNYEVKFNLKPKEQFKTISGLPFIRNFLTTAGYYLVSVK